MPVNVNWGVPGACVIISAHGQVFYAGDPTKWREFDLPGYFDANQSANNFNYPIWRFGPMSVACDLLHKHFWIAATHQTTNNIADNVVDLYKSPTPDFAGGWVKELTVAADFASPPVQYWVNTGLLNSFGGPFGAADGFSGPWTKDGGATWNSSVPPDALLQGFEFPIHKWNDLYLTRQLNAVLSKEPVLTDAHGNHPVPINFPSGWDCEQDKIAAGNGVIVAMLSSLDHSMRRVGVTEDNHSWKMLNNIGEIPSFTPNSANPDGGYDNFVNSFLTFVPNFGGLGGLFVFTGCTAEQFNFSGVSIAQNQSEPPVDASGAAVVPKPLQIYTSPNGLDWTKRFQADYTNGSAPPQSFDGGHPVHGSSYWVRLDEPIYHQVDWPFANGGIYAGKLYDFLFPADGGFIHINFVGNDGPFGIPAAEGLDADGAGIWGPWMDIVMQGAGLNGYSVAGSMPGGITVTFHSPPAYEIFSQFSIPSGFYGDQTFGYSSIFAGGGWSFQPGVRQNGGVLSSAMQPIFIAGSGYSFPILPEP